MNIEKYNEKLEAELNSYYLGMLGDKDFNRKREKIFKYMINNMLKRTMNMFEYKNLPETLSARSIEKYLQGSGTCLIVNVKEEDIQNPKAKAFPGLYALPCKAGGVLDANFLPTTAIVVSAWLGFSGTYDLTKNEAVYMWNDSMLEGLSSMFSLYASELTDNVMTLHFQEVHNRILSILKANSEDEKKDAEDLLSDYENGKFAVLLDEGAIENLKANRVDQFKGSATSTIKDSLEVRQWLLAHWNIELGLNDNYNMKREAINENEIEANSDTLTPLLDDMYKCRKRGVDEINRIFGTNIEVDFSSSWKRVHKREENAQKQEDLQLKALENGVKEPKADESKEGEPKTDDKPKENEQ